MPNIVICYKNPKLNNTDIPPCQQPNKPFTEWERGKADMCISKRFKNC